MKAVLVLLFICTLAACTSASKLTLYQQLDGKAGITRLVDSFINQIGNDEIILPYFSHANVAHFRAGFISHLCALTNGSCEYKGDSMVDIHTGMHITEADFNRVVDLLINAMNEQQISHSVQNQILAKMAPLRAQIIKI
ncbi:group 1 truncated hemoglobin [Pseudoalteromonas shioyasakiensis]|uniref:group I truncated hemoglobin n=1 Tax=Pseudoalteromonas shioyasakiensis TaxID=1190813 RepID=UPI00211840FC|nr:group 1 truncated hemoglobin [Pseudoalteromonas shioyasakiensis]MCQ8879958.1 group 1 truncated hemoglobin [Pseudoalteromonas shioyasakiensis]